MKKFLSIVAVLALVFALTIPALAVDSSPAKVIDGKAATDAVKEATATDDNGTALNYVVKNEETGEEETVAIHVEVTEAEMTKQEEDTIQDAAAAAAEKEGTEASTIEVVDASLKDAAGNDVSEDYFDVNPGASVKVAFVRDDANQVVAVLYWNDDTKAWDSADFTKSDGKIVATFEHFCTVAFVMEEATPVAPTPTPAPGGDNGGKGGGTQGGPVKSPQTGYDTGLWALLTVAMVLGAAVCFAASRKKVNE